MRDFKKEKELIALVHSSVRELVLNYGYTADMILPAIKLNISNALEQKKSQVESFMDLPDYKLSPE